MTLGSLPNVTVPEFPHLMDYDEEDMSSFRESPTGQCGQGPVCSCPVCVIHTVPVWGRGGSDTPKAWSAKPCTCELVSAQRGCLSYFIHLDGGLFLIPNKTCIS